MIRVCAWCQKIIGEKEPIKDKSLTHGICKICAEDMHQKLIARQKERKEKMSNPINKWYIGVSENKDEIKAFISSVVPTKKTYPKFIHVIGPFESYNAIIDYINKSRPSKLIKKNPERAWHAEHETTYHMLETKARDEGRTDLVDYFKGKRMAHGESVEEEDRRAYFKSQKNSKHSEKEKQAYEYAFNLVKSNQIKEAKNALISEFGYTYKDATLLIQKIINYLYMSNPNEGYKLGQEVHDSYHGVGKIIKINPKEYYTYTVRYFKYGKYAIERYTELGIKEIVTYPLKKNPAELVKTRNEIEFTAVELFLQGHKINDINVFLQKEFGIDRIDAEYYIRKAGKMIYENA